MPFNLTVEELHKQCEALIQKGLAKKLVVRAGPDHCYRRLLHGLTETTYVTFDGQWELFEEHDTSGDAPLGAFEDECGKGKRHQAVLLS